jgi:cytochrome b involved in lipid metabolism
MKTTISLLVLFAIVLGGGYWWSQRGTDPITENPQTAAPVTATSSQATSTTESMTVASFTMAEVATHATAQSCWSVVDATIYDLTAWISQHPGGAAKILAICGKDGSQAFNGMHGSNEQAKAALASFKIGVVAQ